MKQKPLKLKRAWVVLWWGSNTHTKPPAAILNYRLNARSVADVVEQLYAAEYYSPAEMLRIAKDPKSNPYPAVVSPLQSVTCGHNPFLVARQVIDLRVEGDRVVWTELPSEAERYQQLVDAGLIRPSRK